MKLPMLAVLLFASHAASARTEFQARCEDTLAQAAPVLTTRENGYKVDNTVSYRQLGQMKRYVPANSYVLGLTRAESRVSIGAGGTILSDPASGYECVIPKVDVDLYFTPIVVYVGREFPEASCAYREILAHEMRHLNTYMAHLPKVENVLRAALVKRFSGRPLYAPAGQAQALLQKEMDNGWKAFVQAEMEKVEPLQAAIDSPAEYARLGKVCGGEVQSLIASAKRNNL